MRRSFKAATVFAGTAVLTGGFAPAAHAATVTTEICGANDTGGISHWLHLFYPNDDHPAECVHGSGDVPAKGTITAYCAGGTSGWLFGKYTTTGQFAAVPFLSASNARWYFSDSNHARTNFVISSIWIQDTGKNYKCTS
jgi:hypothetical protein